MLRENQSPNLRVMRCMLSLNHLGRGLKIKENLKRNGNPRLIKQTLRK